MTRYLVLLVCGFSLISPVAAQTADQKAQIERGIAITKKSGMFLFDAVTRAMERCTTARIAVPRPRFEFFTMTETTVDTVVSIEWTGGCVDGKRDGDGVLAWKEETSWQRAGSQNQMIHSRKAEGRFVKGQRLGLWCTTFQSMATFNGKPAAPGSFSGCQVLTANALDFDLYRKQPDGSWRLYQADTPTDTTLAAGSLEAQSAKVLANAAAGKTGMNVELVATTQTLDDLVAGSKIVIARSATPILLKDKRIAVILSSKTLSELERFKRERQALITASSGLRGQAAGWRTRFIAASVPEHLLTAVAKTVLKHAKTVQSVDDLVGLQKGEFDYALVLDWKHMTRFDLLGKYDSFPISEHGKEPAPACESLGTFLISADLKAVKQGAPYPNCFSKFAGETGDEGYMAKLAMFFELHWGQDHRVTMFLEDFLKP